MRSQELEREREAKRKLESLVSSLMQEVEKLKEVKTEKKERRMSQADHQRSDRGFLPKQLK